MDKQLERTVVAIAHALFMNRLHVLRLTEVVRLGIKPDSDDGDNFTLPEGLDKEMRELSLNYVLTCLPDFANAIDQVKVNWLRPA
jgi:hypothetical protein